MADDELVPDDPTEDLGEVLESEGIDLPEIETPDADDAAPEVDPDAPAAEAEEKPDALERAVMALAESDPEAAEAIQALLSGVEPEAEAAPAPVETPTAIVAENEEVRVAAEKSDLISAYTNFEQAEVNNGQAWREAYSQYEQAIHSRDAYINRQTENGLDPDPDQLSLHAERIAAKLERNNQLARETREAAGAKKFLEVIDREIRMFPEFGKYPALYTTMRANGALPAEMPVLQKREVLRREAAKQGLLKTDAKGKLTPEAAKRIKAQLAKLSKPASQRGAAAGKARAQATATAGKDYPAWMSQYTAKL
jgi:hypothetical protein